jgi:hypothetical protein
MTIRAPQSVLDQIASEASARAKRRLRNGPITANRLRLVTDEEACRAVARFIAAQPN